MTADDERTLDQRLQDYAILRVREQGVMTQREFARLCERDETWASHYLSRNRQLINLDTSMKIARALHVDIAQLTGLPHESDPDLASREQQRLGLLHRLWAQIPDCEKATALNILRAFTGHRRHSRPRRAAAAQKVVDLD